MASKIDNSKINANYPVAGQNNSSQGFRDNFANIKASLGHARLEINELQQKSVLKTAIDGETLNNNMAWAPIFRAQLRAHSETFFDHGSVNGVVSFDYSVGTVQKVTLIGTIVLSLGNFPPLGQVGRLIVWVTVPDINFQVILPESVVFGIDHPQIFNRQIRFTRPGDYLLEFATADNGYSFWLVKFFGSGTEGGSSSRQNA